MSLTESFKAFSLAEMHTDYYSDHLHKDKHRRHACACVCLWCSILFLTILLVCVTVGIRYTGSHSVLEYSSSVGDTHLFGYSPYLCTGSQVSVASDGSYPVATMYFLDEEPPLSTSNFVGFAGIFSFNVADDYDLYDYEPGSTVYAAWQYHLNPGSVIKAASCVLSGGAANFFIVQGTSNYNKWTHSLNQHYAYAVIGIQACFSGSNLIYSFSIEDEGYYYVVYSAQTSAIPTITLGLSINRTEYSTEDVSGMPNCTIPTSGNYSCSAQSLSSSKYVLLEAAIQTSLSVTTLQYFTYQWACDSHDGAYVLIFFLPLIILALLFCGCFGVYCVCDYLCRPKYGELREDHPDIHAKHVSEKPPPPPYSAGPL